MDELRSYGWCAPSEALLDVYSTPPVNVPQDCGGPHEWEKFSAMDNQCGCSHCGTERWYWMECANCMATWNVDVMTDETRAIFEAAPWG